MDREDPPALGEEVAALWGRARRADLVLYGLVALLVGVGACARPLWERADPRVRVWSAWHSGSEALDPWGQAFLDDARGGLRSAGPNGLAGDVDDVPVPRVAPGELRLYEALGWVPWILGLGLAIGWEALRWLGRPGTGLLRDELPLAAIGAAAVGLGLGVGIELAAARSREIRELVAVLPGPLPAPLTLGGSAALAAGLGLLAIRLRAAPAASEAEEPRA